ncbi:MAG TPA: hypothetical protein PKE65_02060 [Rhizobiaceae bacterium]|nr:hypothetical protein [Rhizobiaceae bacterium]
MNDAAQVSRGRRQFLMRGTAVLALAAGFKVTPQTGQALAKVREDLLLKDGWLVFEEDLA